jgi:ABC-type multidrug transport system fused ATPase/permease subunit
MLNTPSHILQSAGTVQGRPGPGAEGAKPEHQAQIHLLLMLKAQMYGAAFNMVPCKLQVRYREDLDLVLKGLSLSIKPCEKIGIVGRTGCGKSTLMSTLFRIVEPTGGRVVIDGHDLAQVPLHQLRTKLALVPQVRNALLWPAKVCCLYPAA